MAIGDEIAIKIQSLRTEGKVDDERPLLRLDYRDEAADAPFQFDIANAKLHRTDCPGIPTGSKTALYAVWNLKADDNKLACKRCRPLKLKGCGMKKDFTKDIMYGFLSIIDQFGSVLIERGREYRSSKHGKEVAKTVEGIFEGLDKTQKDALSATLQSLDGLLKIVRDYNAGVGGLNAKSNGKGNGNGNGKGTRVGKMNGKRPHRTKGS